MTTKISEIAKQRISFGGRILKSAYTIHIEMEEKFDFVILHTQFEASWNWILLVDQIEIEVEFPWDWKCETYKFFELFGWEN